MRVEATITQIRMEAFALSNWWIVTAEWSEPETGQAFTFRSDRIKYRPHYHMGERIVVNFEADEPKHYQIELKSVWD